MHLPVLKTKLNTPKLSDKHIPRKRITSLLHTAISYQLVLVSAPAGSGKSSLVVEWLQSQNTPYIWYALDEWDNSFQQFMTYFIDGLRELDPECGEQMNQLLDAYQTLGHASFIRSAAAILLGSNSKLILVLDDYQLIHNAEIHDFIRTLIDHVQEKVLTVLITREDPDLPISKLRLNENVLEIRDAHLRFNKDESSELINSYFNSPLASDHIEKLTSKVEGWAAGLQLSALSMREYSNIEKFVDSFTGSNYYIFDYLLDEVLKNLPERIRDFLLYSSILGPFCCELCDYALSYDPGTSRQIVDWLMQKNMFTIPLDEDQKWYRYHHLFGDILQNHLSASSSTSSSNIDKSSIYDRSGKWYEDHNHLLEATDSYLKSQNYKSAASLIECMWAEMDLTMQASLWISMANKLPKSIVLERPVLSMGYGWALIDTGEMHAAFDWLTNAITIYDKSKAKGLMPPVSDMEEYDLLPATVSSAFAYIAASKGDIDGLLKNAKNALAATPERHSLRLGVVRLLTAFAHWSKGKFEEAEKTILLGINAIDKSKYQLTVNSFYQVMSEMFIQQGRLKKAEQIIRKLIDEISNENQLPVLIPGLYLGLAKIEYLRCHTIEALSYLEKSKIASDEYMHMDWQYRYDILSARIALSESRFDLANNHIKSGQKSYFFNPIPDDVSLEFLCDQLDLLRDEADALLVERIRSVTDKDSIAYSDFKDMILVSRALIHEKIFAPSEVDSSCKSLIRKLTELKETPEMIERYGDKLTIDVIVSRLYKLLGDRNSFKIRMESASKLAQSDMYFRPFSDYLEEPDYRQYIKVANKSRVKTPENQALAEPLTERELDVLELIVAGYSNKEIAEELFLALSTVKGYIQNIYGKLEVKRRTEAVAKAQKLGL